MEKGMGHKKWCIPDLYMKEAGDKPTPSHESITLLNTGERFATVDVVLIFDGDEKKEIKGMKIKGQSAVHLRMDQLEKWEIEISRSRCYSAIITSTENIVVEYARLNWIDGAAQSFAILAYHD